MSEQDSTDLICAPFSTEDLHQAVELPQLK